MYITNQATLNERNNETNWIAVTYKFNSFNVYLFESFFLSVKNSKGSVNYFTQIWIKYDENSAQRKKKLSERQLITRIHVYAQRHACDTSCTRTHTYTTSYLQIEHFAEPKWSVAAALCLWTYRYRYSICIQCTP